MRILLVYATNSGGTFAASEIIEQVLSAKHKVRIQKAGETKPEDFNNYDLVIFGSPSWDFGDKQGQPHETFLQLMTETGDKKFPNKKFAIFGLGDSSYTYFCGAVDALEKFVNEIGGKKIGQSLRIDGFYFDLDKNKALVKSWAEKLLGVIDKT